MHKYDTKLNLIIFFYNNNNTNNDFRIHYPMS